MLAIIKPIFLLVISFTCVFTIGSCSYKDDKKTEDTSVLEQAKIQIHNERYSEAETTLNKFLLENPKNARATIVLASLYVHRAGLRVEDHFHLEEAINSKPSETETYLEKSYLQIFTQSDSEEMQELGEKLMRFNSVILQIQTWKDKIERLPKLSETQAQDLEHAISILSTLTPRSNSSWTALPSNTIENPDEIVTNGMILYRAAIKIFYFKFLWQKGDFLPVMDKMICNSTLANLKFKIDYLENYIQDLLTDFSIGLPNSKEKALEQKKVFSKNAAQLTLWLQDIHPQTQSLAELITKIAKVEGFKCNF